MGAAVKDYKAGFFLEHEALLMGKTVRHPAALFFQIHMLPFAGFLHRLSAVRDKPYSAARPAFA